MEYGLIGEKLGHSYSPQIHAQLAQYHYVLHPVARNELHAFMKEADFKGINVTIPYKKDVIPYCASLSDDAREIGCVNTIVKQPDGSLFGHNTDIAGFTRMLQHAGIEPDGKKAVILGSGGTSLTASIALKRMGACEIVVISRSGENNYTALYEKHADAELLVNTTPVGMFPNNGQSPADLSKLPALESVVDVIYNPEKTALIQQAQALGMKTVSGLYMLVSQARHAAELFTGAPIDPCMDELIVAAIKKETLNLVLAGMPGCGKSTLGQLLAKEMNRPLLDTDSMVEQTAGKTIPEIFEQDGEEAFRALETLAVQKACSLQGHIITTGGGAILKDENRMAMKQNGRVCVIERPLELLARNGRPLSQGENALENLWQKREPYYRKTADFSVLNAGEIETAVQAIMEGFYEAADH